MSVEVAEIMDSVKEIHDNANQFILKTPFRVEFVAKINRVNSAHTVNHT